MMTTVPSANFVSDLVEAVNDKVEEMNETLDTVCMLLTTQQGRSLPCEKIKNYEPADIPPYPLVPEDTMIDSTPEMLSKTVQWADIVDSADEGDTATTMVAMNTAIQKKTRKPLPTPLRPQATTKTPLAPMLQEEFGKLTEEELLQRLKERQVQRQEARRPPFYLTDEEKALSMDALHRLWKVERQRLNNEREALSRHDFESLGDLTEAQKQLPRSAVRQIIRQRKSEVWAQAMRARGIPVHQCDVCYELTTGNHRCIATKWTTDQTKNAAVSKGLVLTQSPGGVRLHASPIIDPEKLQKEYERLSKLREELEAKAKLAQPLVPLTDTTMALEPTTTSQNVEPLHV
jgi:hypothetical protein